MGTATTFLVGFVDHIPEGALLVISDSAMTPLGGKPLSSDVAVNESTLRVHLTNGIGPPVEPRDSGESVEHLRSEWSDRTRGTMRIGGRGP